MKIEEIAQILGMGKSLVEEYIRILNEEEWLMGEKKLLQAWMPIGQLGV